MQQGNKKADIQINHKLTREMYNLYVPPVYGKILSIVREDQIAEKILEKVFVYAYKNNTTFPLRSPLMSLIDIAHDKSSKTVNALTIFRACCAGATISITDKKK
ncbi:MAG: hypothetical protein IPG60_10275 [Bacteroidetes bacterium]|nr:hypothetical protein [Bacteroidota bacterium]MBP7398398.1 hypothetical protein [Chitinophagales bacterium]MBK8680708.1 hypothetical protein [Bacteroidota bacterium]MBP8753677.1 hypothetical protein [Chitinophagales bacterium]MBP9189173.1 hypothetical protein [Chitinophagales bacterium]